MPIYEYECKDCGIHEHFFWLSEVVPVIECPKCKKDAEKVIAHSPSICDRANLRLPQKNRSKILPN